MKTIVLKVLEFAKVILPFFVKTNKKDSKEFSDLIKGSTSSWWLSWRRCSKITLRPVKRFVRCTPSFSL